MLGAVLVHDAGDRFQPFFLGQLVLVMLELFLAAAFALDRVIGVVAVVELAGAVVNLDHTVAALVNEPAVVRNNHHRAAIGLEVTAQPIDRVHVQMVGRLVQQQNVGLLQDDARQVDARLFAAREQRERLRAHGCGDFQAVAHTVDLKITVVAAEELQTGFKLGVAFEQRGVFRLAGHLIGQRVHRGGDLVGFAESQAQHILDRGFRREIRHLVDHARVLARAKRNMPPVIGQAAGEDIKQGGLARAVRAQNGDLFPWLDIKGNIL